MPPISGRVAGGMLPHNRFSDGELTGDFMKKIRHGKPCQRPWKILFYTAKIKKISILIRKKPCFLAARENAQKLLTPAYHIPEKARPDAAMNEIFAHFSG